MAENGHNTSQPYIHVRTNWWGTSIIIASRNNGADLLNEAPQSKPLPERKWHDQPAGKLMLAITAMVISGGIVYLLGWSH